MTLLFLATGGSDAGVALGSFGAVMLVLLASYLLPGIIASNRKHHNAGAIWALNILAGWTLAGWIIAFVWSCTRTDSPQLPSQSPRLKV